MAVVLQQLRSELLQPCITHNSCDMPPRCAKHEAFIAQLVSKGMQTCNAPCFFACYPAFATFSIRCGVWQKMDRRVYPQALKVPEKLGSEGCFSAVVGIAS